MHDIRSASVSSLMNQQSPNATWPSGAAHAADTTREAPRECAVSAVRFARPVAAFRFRSGTLYTYESTITEHTKQLHIVEQ